MSFMTDSNRIAEQLRAAKPKTKAKHRVFDPPFELIDRKQVEVALGISRSGIYGLMAEDGPYHDPTFPRPLRVGARAVKWRADEITAWMKALPRAKPSDLDEEADASRSGTTRGEAAP